MRYRYFIVDVFSPAPFAGNQLAVIPDAVGLRDQGMQLIAREFNFAETTFVLPPSHPAHTCRVRIFTPKAEVPFAGHPTIGTACVLARTNLCDVQNSWDLLLEEGIGPVPVTVSERSGALEATFTLQTRPDLPTTLLHAVDLASVLTLPPSEVLAGFFAGLGVRFCYLHLRSRDAVDRAQLDRSAWSRVLSKSWSSNVFLFAGDPTNGAKLYARMFAPALGIEEDPATGSACAILVAALADRQKLYNGSLELSVLQGVALGRRSEIQAVAHRADGELTSIGVGGVTSFVAEGEIDVPSHLTSS